MSGRRRRRRTWTDPGFGREGEADTISGRSGALTRKLNLLIVRREFIWGQHSMASTLAIKRPKWDGESQELHVGHLSDKVIVGPLFSCRSKLKLLRHTTNATLRSCNKNCQPNLNQNNVFHIQAIFLIIFNTECLSDEKENSEYNGNFLLPRNKC